MADGTTEGIVSNEVEHEIFPTMTADTLCVPRTHRTIDHGHSSIRQPCQSELPSRRERGAGASVPITELARKNFLRTSFGE